MADITLSDYAGFILKEMIKAREMADAYSRSVAERYAQDAVMRFFPAPRFRIPKMDLTIPILVSGARFTQVVRLDLPLAEFVTFIGARADDVRATVELAQADGLRRERGEVRALTRPPVVKRLAREFHAQLMANPDAQHPDAIVSVMWANIFRACLGQARLVKFYEEWDPAHDLLARTTKEVLDMVRQRTVVDRTAIESLLVNPETNVVKNGSSETSVFTVNAELLEEGVFFRTVRDDETQQTHTVVEFE